MSIKQILQQVFHKKQPKRQPEHPTPKQTPYAIMGGEAAVRRLANRFYDVMETAPEARELLAIHPQPLDAIRQKFFEFLSGWLGGPALFEEKYGHPRLRARHLPFTVNQQLRDQWMFCMDQALNEVVEDTMLREGLRQSLGQLASHMVNTN
ncbi:group II truncated hemoglobin [Alkalimonas delamerensis]|uniref:Group II truncated hemoglobin n=1 Tax=Alkalimonas delamerensis TaxID=265981 RepID=A0ABT9GTC3_9GAMM|nr:group II truncated hemoglobin [Alkalimonas delamerensis]MDP4530224.1 group II truncated hemoglobin [Alkalimonas delamerensis]